MIEIIFNSGTADEFVVPNDSLHQFEIFNSDNSYFQSAHFTLHNLNFTPNINDTVQIYINDSLQFDGYVSRVNKNLAGTEVYKIQAVGRTYDLWRYFVSQATFANKTSAYIASSLVSSFTNLNPTYINPTEGVLIDNITFKNKTVGDCLAQLTKTDNYKFFVDNSGSVHYYANIIDSIGTFTDQDILKLTELEFSDDKLYNEIHLTGGDWYSTIIDYSTTPTDRIYISSSNEYVAIRIDKPTDSIYLKGFDIYLSKSSTSPNELCVQNLDDSFNEMTESGQVLFINSDRLSSSTAWTDWINYFGSGVKVPAVSFLRFKCPNLTAGTWWGFECKDVPASNTYNITPDGYSTIIGVRNSYNFGSISGNTIKINFEGKSIGDYIRGNDVLNSYGEGSLACSGLADDTPKIYISGSISGQNLSPSTDYVTLIGNDRHTFPRFQIGLYDPSKNFGFGIAYSLVREPVIDYFVILSWAQRLVVGDERGVVEFRKVDSNGNILISKDMELYQGEHWFYNTCRNGYFKPGIGAVHVIVFRDPSGDYHLRFVFWRDSTSTSEDKIINKYSGPSRSTGAAAYYNGYWYIVYHKDSNIYIDKWSSNMASKIGTHQISLTPPESGYTPIAINFAYTVNLPTSYLFVSIIWGLGSTYKTSFHTISFSSYSEVDHLTLDYENWGFGHYLLERFYPPIVISAWGKKLAIAQIKEDGTINKLFEKVLLSSEEHPIHVSITTGDIFYNQTSMPFLKEDDVGIDYPDGVDWRTYNGYYLGNYIYYVCGFKGDTFRRYNIINGSDDLSVDLGYQSDYTHRRGNMILVTGSSWIEMPKVAPVIFTKWNDSQYDNQVYLGIFVPSPSSITLYVDDDYNLHFDTGDNRSQVIPQHKLFNGVGFGDYVFNFENIYAVVAGTSVISTGSMGTIFYKISGSLEIYADNPSLPLIYKSTDSGNTWVPTNKMAILKTGWDMAPIEAHASSQGSIDIYGRHVLVKSFPDITSVNVLQNIANSLLYEYSTPSPYGSILISGNTNLEVGKLFSIQSSRLGNYDDLLIKSYRHKFNKKYGFVSEVRFGEEEFNIAAEVARLKRAVFGGNIT